MRKPEGGAFRADARARECRIRGPVQREPAWNDGEAHTVTAICYSHGSRVSLQLLVDGRSLLTTSDGAHPGPFKAAALVQGPIETDLQRFTVSTVS
jgi:hypothetical protein